MAESTGKAYSLATAEVGALPYIDRIYEITGVSEGLDGGVLVRTANDDKHGQAEDHLRLHLNAEGIVYVCYDKRVETLPSWLDDGTWTLTDESVSTTDSPASPCDLPQCSMNQQQDSSPLCGLNTGVTKTHPAQPHNNSEHGPAEVTQNASSRPQSLA